MSRRPLSDPVEGEHEFRNLITPYALDKVKGQLKSSKKVTVKDGGVEGVTVTQSTCSCLFYSSNQLPCRHILAVRKSTGLPLADLSIIHSRWHLGQYIANASTSRQGSSTVTVASIATKSKRASSAMEKYRKAYRVCKELASLATEVNFEERLCQLTKLKEAWAENQAVMVADVLIHSANSEGRFFTISIFTRGHIL